MTDDQIKSLRDDIAYMKAMAEEGSRGPLLGGAILVAAGLIFGAGAVAHWAIDTGVLDLPPVAFSYLWIGAGLVFLAVLFTLSRRLGGRPGAMSPANRAAGTAWMGVGLAIFALGISIAVISIKLRDPLPTVMFPPMIFALYGAGWAVSAAMSGQRWMWWVAIGGWAAAPLIAWFTGEPVQYLIYAAGLLLLTTLPGLVMMRQEPSDVV